MQNTNAAKHHRGDWVNDIENPFKRGAQLTADY